MEARPLGEPPMNQRGLVGPVVIETEVHVQPDRHRAVDGVEELPEFRGAMAPVTLAQDFAALHVEGREEGGRPVAAVIVGAALRLAWAHRQQRLYAVERLNL